MSAQYGQYLTPEQFAARFGPTAAQVQQVSAYLRRHGMTVDGGRPYKTGLDSVHTAAG